jgi:PAS domain S-box-containing protein
MGSEVRLGLPRALAWTGAAAGLIVSLSGYALYRSEARAIRADKSLELQSIATLKTQQFVDLRSRMLSDARLLSSGILEAYLSRWRSAPQDDASRQVLLKRLRTIMAEKGYRNAALLSPDGRVWLSPDPRLRELGAQARDWLKHAAAGGGRGRGELLLSRSGGDVHLDAAAEISDGSGRAAGALLLRADAEKSLFAYIQHWPVPSRTSEVLLVRRDGDWVVFLNKLRHSDAPALSLRIPLSRTDVPAVQAVLGQTGMYEGPDYRGVPVLGYLGAVPGSPWFMVVKEDKAEILADLNFRGVVIIILCILGTSGVVGFAAFWYTSREKRILLELSRVQGEMDSSIQRFRDLFQNTGDLTFILKPAPGRAPVILDVNRAATEACAYPRDEMIGRPITDFETLESAAHVRERMRMVMAGDEVSFEVEFLAKSGAKILADCMVRMTRIETEDLIMVSGRDITQRKKAEESMRALYARQQSLLAAVPDIIVEVDNDKVIRWMNRAGFDFFGEDALGKEVSTYFVGEQPTYAVVAPLFAGQEDVICLESWQRRRDGEKRLLAWWCRTLKDGQGTVLGAISAARDITERKQEEETLQMNEARLRSLIEIFQREASDAQAFMCLALEQALALTGSKFGFVALYDEGHKQMIINNVSPGLRGTHAAGSAKPVCELASAGLWGEPLRQRKPVIVNDFSAPTSFDKAGPEGYASFSRFLGMPVFKGEHVVAVAGIGDKAADYTATDVLQVNLLLTAVWKMVERKQMELRLAQGQRLETVGRLAGGVAHDFNNMLTAILSYGEMLRNGFAAQDPRRGQAQDIVDAANRAASLTRQLLIFSRRQVMSPVLLDLNEEVKGMSSMLHRVIGENILIEKELSGQPCLVRSDPGHMEQVILNLAVNARDAMPEGGILKFKTEIIYEAPESLKVDPGAAARPLACLSVTDSGVGMSPEIQGMIFEPFFTTKESGQGTGLGLPLVFGIVKESGGEIVVESSPGQGACFKIYLPLAQEQTERTAAQELPPPGHGQETILLVEDEGLVRRLAVSALSSYGYQVLAASSGREALQKAAAHVGPIHLLATDVIMPGMSGPNLALEFKRSRPDARILYMSGFTDETIAPHGVVKPGLSLLRKPFNPEGLARKVREVLDGAADRAQA